MNQIDLSHIRAVLFDLDGTLLQVEMSTFIPRYVSGLAKCFEDLVPPKKFRKIFLNGIRELLLGDANGETNEARLLAALNNDISISLEEFRLRLQHFQVEGVDALADMVVSIPEASTAVEFCRLKGQKLVLATNPVFPMFMIEARRRWSGLGEASFDHVTSFENSCYCKPHQAYFTEVAEAIGVPAEQCLMVGNDSSHDLAAMGVGMTTYLVDTYLVERPGRRWPSDYRGNHSELLTFLTHHLPGLRPEKN